MYRRIVTDGEVFRVQYRVSTVSEWQFYTVDYDKHAKAQAALDQMEIEERRNAPDRWKEVV